MATYINHPLYKELIGRPLAQIKRSGSVLYRGFWDGFYGNPYRKYTKGSSAWIAMKAGQDKAKLERFQAINCLDNIIHKENSHEQIPGFPVRP